MRSPAYVAASLIFALGLLALISPERFGGLVTVVQAPPVLYVAAAIRFFVGVCFIAAARSSRGQMILIFLGVVMIAGGILTPILGQGPIRPVLDAWLRGGNPVFRAWGGAALLLAMTTFWALRPRSTPE